MGIASGQYDIDGYDLYDTYGWVTVKADGKGKDAFLKFPDAKPPALSKDWPDENGTEYDLTGRVSKEKEILIDGLLVANTYDEFWTKHTSFFNLLISDGTRRMYVNSLSRSFFVFYDSCTDFGMLEPLTGQFEGMIGCKYSLKFIEPVPSFWAVFHYLIDIDGNYITTQDGDYISITT